MRVFDQQLTATHLIVLAVALYTIGILALVLSVRSAVRLWRFRRDRREREEKHRAALRRLGLPVPPA